MVIVHEHLEEINSFLFDVLRQYKDLCHIISVPVRISQVRKRG